MTPDFKPHTLLAGRYAIVRELGRGGMATVYLADDRQLGRQVAVKVLAPEVAGVIGPDRFQREIAVAAKFSHPHIVPLLDSGAQVGTNGAPSILYYVMGFVEGESLRDRLLRERQLPVDVAVRIAHEVALALTYAHARGVVHRDIKPENILLTGGTAVVADFGIAKLLDAGTNDSGPQLTETGISLGTAGYMSPEQATGSDIDGRSDLYSLSTVLYEMLVGEPPYTGPNALAITAKRLMDPVPSARRLRESIPPALDEVITRGLQRAPADRFPTATEFAAALEHARRGAPTAPAPAVVTQAEPVARRAARGSRRWRVRGTLLIVAVLVAGGLVVQARRRAAAPHGALRSLAILPFEDLSPTHDQEYFAAGMTDELITALSRLAGLRVAARTSSRVAKARGASPREIGHALGVDAVLDGSVRRAGDSLRIAVQLVSTADDSTRWSESYDGSLKDVFRVQERIARSVAQALQLELAASRQLVARPTADLESYQLYLKGRLALAQRTAASINEATRYFLQVVERDPGSARAWTGLADAYAILALNYWGPPGDLYPRSKAAALRAIALDSTTAEAQTSLAIVSFLYDRDWTAAEREFRKASIIDPTYPTAHYFYSIFLSGRLRFDEAITEAQRAHQLDPLSPPLSQGVGMALVLAGRPAEAAESLNTAIQEFPDYYFPYAWIGVALASSGHPDSGIREARRAVELAPGNVLVQSFLGITLASAGRDAEARRVAAAVAARDPDSLALPCTYIARIYAGIGDREQAFAWLRRAVRTHEGQVATMLTAGFERIRSDPRFDEIARQAGVR
jgi:TolB-like protein/Tfp pilus assembly protein PilF